MLFWLECLPIFNGKCTCSCNYIAVDWVFECFHTKFIKFNCTWAASSASLSNFTEHPRLNPSNQKQLNFWSKTKKIQVDFHSKFCWKNIFGRFDESIYYIFQFTKPNSINGEFEFNFLKFSIRYSMLISICAICIEKKVCFLLQTDAADIRKYINDWYVSIACKPNEWKLRWWRKKNPIKKWNRKHFTII